MERITCPFRHGDRVVYRPSDSGHRYEQHRSASTARHLEPGQCYQVAEVIGGEWVTLCGFEDRPDGWYWTEFHLVDLTGTSAMPGRRV